MYDAILVPTDGSPGTEAVLEHALTIAKDHDATVHGLYVVDRRRYTAAADGQTAEIRESLREEGEEALAAVRSAAEDAGVPVVTESRDGIPHREILTYADAADVDLIAIGTHGRTGPDRLAHLGSTTERVVKNGDVPVLVVDI
ncbi:MAG: universal stress protein [Salinirussus sp.]